MTSYLVESYAPRAASSDLAQAISRARAAAASVSIMGNAVRHITSYLVPGDEMCLHVFEADDLSTIQRVADLAGLQSDRISEVVR